MALSQRDAVDTVRGIMEGPRIAERRRLERIASALRPASPTVQLPRSPTAAMRMLAEKAQTNYLPLILNVMAQSLIVDGYKLPSNDPAPQWVAWQKNRMDARQAGVHRAALAYGCSYVTVLPGADGAAIRGVSPRKMTAVYEDLVEDDWPVFALRDDAETVRLYDDEAVYYFTRSLVGSQPEFVERRDHGMGVCPVVRFRDRMLLDEDEQTGIIEPLIDIQRRVDETVFGLLTAQYYAAFKQRWVIGWVPESEAEELKASAAEFWSFEDPEVKVGEFSETDLTRYIDSKDSAVGDMATISQVPKQNLGVGSVANLSAEALAAMEASKDRQAGEFQTSLGESWEQVLDLAEPGPSSVDAQVRWKDTTARSFAQMVDGLGKMRQMLEVPKEATWERIPGVSDGDITRWRTMAESDDALGSFTRLLDEQARGLPAGL